MPTPAATRISWDARLGRALELASVYPVAADQLNFYREVATFQKALHEHLGRSGYDILGSRSRLPEDLDTFVVLPKLQTFFSVVQRAAPQPLAKSARQLEAYGPERWSEMLSEYWRGVELAEEPTVEPTEEPTEMSSAEQFVTHAFLQPVAEYLAERGDFDSSENYAHGVCPFCGRRPVVGVLRPEGEGAKRSLACCFCGTEWQFRRIFCPKCGETDRDKLPVFIAAEFEHLRVECCDSCKTFIKTVDLTKQGRAVPVVDELASLPLTLWAEDKGYSKLQRNLLGT